MATTPSIAMIPSGYQAEKIYSVLPTNGDADLNFSRSGVANRINSDGLIEEMAINVPRLDYSDGTCPSLLLEPQSTNLITYPLSFGNSYWTKSGASIEGDASTAGAELITLQNDREFTTTVGNWAGYNGATILWQSVGRVDVTMNTGAPAWSGITLPNSALSSTPVVGNIYKLEIELEQGNAFVNNIRIDFGGATQDVTIGANQVFTVYLKAISTSQLYVYAVPDENAKFWLIRSVSVKEVQGFSSPSVDNPLGAFKLVEGSNNGNHKLFKSGVTITSGIKNTHYFYAKAGGRNWVRLTNDNMFSSSAYFDLSNGVVGTVTGLSAEIKSLVNGWYKCSVTYLTTTTDSYPVIQLASADNSTSYQGDGTSGVYIFGAQLEALPYATSLMLPATEGSTVTRVAETASKSGLSSEIGQTEGTIFIDFNVSNVSPKFIFSLDDGGISDFILLDTTPVNEIGLKIRQSSGSITRVILGNVLSIGNHKIGVNYKSGDYSLYVDGNLEGTSTSTLFPSGIIGRLSVGGNSSYGNLSDTVNDFKLYNTRLSNSELQALTQV